MYKTQHEQGRDLIVSLSEQNKELLSLLQEIVIQFRDLAAESFVHSELLDKVGLIVAKKNGFHVSQVERALPEDARFCWRLSDKRGNMVGEFCASEQDAWNQISGD